MDQNNESPRIVFEGEQFRRPNKPFQTPTPKIVEWIIKYPGGIVKDEKQANYVLFGIVVLMVVISLFLFFNKSDMGSTRYTPPYPSSL